MTEWGTAQYLGDRPVQQDVAIVRPVGDAVVALVADGMGGHAEGARAAAVVAENFVAAVAHSSGAWPVRFMAGLREGHAALQKAFGETAELASAGTTLAAVALAPDGLWHISVGDSSVSTLVDDQLKRLNADHSMLPVLDQQVREGLLDASDLENHPLRNQLRSAVMSDRPLTAIDCPSTPFSLASGAYVLIMSDGMTQIDDATVIRMIDTHLDADAIANEMVAHVAALGRSGQDNATVVVVRKD